MASATGRRNSLLDKAKVPPYLRTNMSQLADPGPLPHDPHFPKPTFAQAIKLPNGTSIPQTIAHRGYKAAFPENTLPAFIGAIDAGTHALETDIHLTKDDVVVLSHDKDLKRCFNRPEKVVDCDYDYISTLRTIATPPSPMPRLSDLLELLARPEHAKIWLLLDIKLDNPSDKVMRLIASTLSSVPSPHAPWSSRLVLGIWATSYLPLCEKYLPGYPVSHIGFSTLYASNFLSVPNIAFNELHQILHGPIGARFLRKARQSGRSVFAWTVNDGNRMRWCVNHGLDGVITDDPKKFREICRDYERRDAALSVSEAQGTNSSRKDEEKMIRAQEKYTAADWIHILRIQLMVAMFIFYFRLKFGSRVEQRFVRKGPSWEEKVLGRTI